MKAGILKRSKLSWKLALIYASIFTLILVLLNFAVLYGVRFFLISQATNSLNNISNKIGAMIIGSPSEKTPLNDPELIDEATIDPEISVRIATPAGGIVNKSSNFGDAAIDIGITDEIDHIRQLTINNTSFLIKNNRITDQGETVAYLQVAFSMDRENGFIRVLFFLMLAATILGIALSFFTGYWMSKRMLSPIDRMTSTVQGIDIGDLNTHVEEGIADDELSRLAKTFNKMIDRLRLSFEKQNRFVSDASHELKTPIAVIRGYTDVINKWGRGNDSIFKESIQAIQSETSEMTEMIGKLLMLAKSDSNTLTLNSTKFSISELLEEVTNESKVISQNHIFSFESNTPVMVMADRLMIKQALRAIMENSIKFTPPQGSIKLECTQTDNSVVITVTDNGPGIPGHELENIFERFYRVEKSRSKETGGSGLGLSIVQLIVMAHCGTVSAKSELGQGTSIIITLPI